MAAQIDLSGKTLGFLGCGKISSAVCRGYAGAAGQHKPKAILVSQRSADKSAALQAAFPGLVQIAASNEEIVSASDIVLLGLLPDVARSILPTLPFRAEQLVISMMAAVDITETVALVRLPPERVVRTVPLPSAARRSGPVLLHPPNAEAEAVLSVVATPVACVQEAEMKPLVSLTGHISSFFELMNTSQQFVQQQGVDGATARQFVTAFYSSMAQGAQQSSESLEDMAEEAATPGGLNEQSWRGLKATEHFQLHRNSMQAILDRLNGK